MTFVAGGALKPIGGHILSHASATRIFLRKGMSCQFISPPIARNYHFIVLTLRVLGRIDQVVLRSASRNSSTAQINPSLKLHTSSMKGVGQMSDPRQMDRRYEGGVGHPLGIQSRYHLPVHDKTGSKIEGCAIDSSVCGGIRRRTRSHK